MTPLSASPIWRRQREFYEQKGPAAWIEDDIPWHMSSHAALATCYARLTAAWIDDLVGAGRVDRTETVRVIELGSGAGRFAYAFVQVYEEIRRTLRLPRIIYTLTDFAETNIAAFRAHPAWRSLAAEGLADFMVFDAERPVLNATGPLVCIANYVFDSLPQDYFRVADGVLSEGHVPALSQADTLRFDYAVVAGERYADPALAAVLKELSATKGPRSFLLPTVPLRCLEALRAASGGELLALVGDKAHVRIEDHDHDRAPIAVLHGAGAFSFNVSFPALARWTEHQGGRAHVPAQRQSAFEICALAVDGLSAAPRLADAYAEHVARVSPSDLHGIAAHVPPSFAGQSIDYYLSVMRACACDPSLVTRLVPELMRFRKDARPSQVLQLRRVIAQAARVYLHVRDKDAFLSAAVTVLQAFGAPEAIDELAQDLEKTHGARVDVRAIARAALR